MRDSLPISIGIATLLLAQAPLPARSQQTGQMAGRPGYTVFNRSYAAAQAEFQALQHRLAAHAPSTSIPPPSITGGKILTPALNVSKPRTYIKLSLNISAPGQYEASYVALKSPSGELFSVMGENLPPGTMGGTVMAGTSSLLLGVTLDGTSIQLGSTNLPAGYLQPGSYTLAGAQIMDYAGNTTTYNASQTAALFNGSSITVVNRNKPDYTPPTVVSARILTRKVSRTASQPYVVIQIEATDDYSGVRYLVLGALSASSGQTLSPAGLAAIPFAKGALAAFVQVSPKQAKGTYSITEIAACDAAGNCLLNENSADINTLFGGKTTFEIVE